MACTCAVHTHVWLALYGWTSRNRMLEVNSYIRGYLVYKAVWGATCGNVLHSKSNTIINGDRFVMGCSKLEIVIQSQALAGQM